MNSTLYVYRASAGSGKTFTLALEYMKLLIANPQVYRHILAVTFTNKATGEMKERIMSQLYGVAHALASSKDYMDKLCDAFPRMSSEEIRKRAGIALEMILHDYGHFRIQTIDAFFQTVLRGLAKELELSSDMEISLNGTKLLNDAVDLLIRQLKPTSEQMGWLVEYIEEHLDNDKSWKVRDSIKKFAENILKEEYQERGANLRKQIEENNGASLIEYRKALQSIDKDIKQRVTALGNRFFEITEETHLGVDDFYKKKNGIFGFFKKLQNGTFPDVSDRSAAGICMENTEKISASANLSAEHRNEIARMIREYCENYRKDRRVSNSCRLSLARFHQLRLLDSIGKQLQEENSRENRFLLAQTTYLLSRMIENNTTFIFEKIGSEISHIFIDEFQDTSKLQWQCFRVLLHEVMAHGTRNLIVGDVKQSIYRWRNSDWNILNHIENEFPAGTIARYETADTGEHSQGSTTNYRSERRIIEFNNAFFEQARDIIAASYSDKLGERIADFTKAYNEVKQNIPEHKRDNGYAEIRLLQAEDFEDAAYNQLMETLRVLLLEKGVKPKDITILLRQNRYMPEIARLFNERFKEHNFSIISDEAYRLSSSVAVKIIIAAIRYLAMPEDRINLVLLLMLYLNETKKIATPLQSLMELKEPTTLLPDGFIGKICRLREMPIYELIEQLIVLFELNSMQGEEAFLYSFLDNVSQYLSSGMSDLSAFLQVWDDELSEKTIPAGETDSVRMMTIHKSKGLEFHTVIIPFCTWKLTGETHNVYREKLIWCKPELEPFNNLDLLPIEFTSNMQDSIYEKDFNHEYLFQLVDNMNLLYVAFTRAKCNLFIVSNAEAKKDTMDELLKKMVDAMLLDGVVTDKEQEVLTYGEIVPSKEKEKKSDNPFTQIPTEKVQPFTSFDNRIPFRQSNNLTRFLARDKEEEEQLEYKRLGELMHELLSKLETGNNLELELKKMQVQGLIGDEKECNNIRKLIERALSHPQAREWFSGRYKLFNECSILYRDGDEFSQCRPDRVMTEGKSAIVVDFKFGKHRDEYTAQIEKYKSILKEMGYEDVTGYIWYVYTNKIV